MFGKFSKISTPKLAMITIGSAAICSAVGITSQRYAASLITGNDFYKQSLVIATHHPGPCRVVGKPIRYQKFDVTDEEHASRSGSDLEISFKVSGPQGSGLIHASADISSSNEQWTLKSCSFSIVETIHKIPEKYFNQKMALYRRDNDGDVFEFIEKLKANESKVSK